MINDGLQQFIVDEWDDLVSAAPGEVTLAQSRDALIPTVAAYLEGADRDFEREARLHIDATLRRERQGRTRQMKRDLDWIMDYLTSPDDAAVMVAGLLPKAYPLGTSAGEDKSLRLWTIQDLAAKVTARYRNAAAVTVEAKEFDEAASFVIERMQESHAHTLGALIGEPAEGVAA